MKLTETRNWSVLSFASFSEAVTFASEKRNEDATAVDTSNPRWAGTSDYDAAHKLATHGWAEGRRRVQKLQEAFTVASKAFRPEVTFDVTGNGGMDMGAVLAGIPEAFMDWTESETRMDAVNGPIVHIVFNGSMGAAGVAQSAIENRGAAVLELIDALEAAGKRVELTWVKANTVTEDSAAKFLIEVPLKTADYQVQADQMVFALTHASMNRRIGFSLTTQCGRNGKRAQDFAYGGPLPKGWTYRGADVFIPRIDITNSHQFATIDAARGWVKHTLAAQGIAEEGASHAA